MAVGQLSLYGAQQLLAITFGQSSVPPSTFYFAITTAIPTPDVDGAWVGAHEPSSGANYSRAALPNNTLNFTTVANVPYVVNANALVWPNVGTVGATADWPVCPGWALCDALTGGNVWAIGALAVPLAIPNGFCAYLAPSNLSLELSPFFQIASSS